MCTSLEWRYSYKDKKACHSFRQEKETNVIVYMLHMSFESNDKSKLVIIFGINILY